MSNTADQRAAGVRKTGITAGIISRIGPELLDLMVGSSTIAQVH